VLPTLQPYRTPAPVDKEKEDAAAEVKQQLEALLQQQRDKSEALQQQLAVAQGQLARVAGLQEHGVPLMWQCAVTLNQWIAAWQQGLAPAQQLADWRWVRQGAGWDEAGRVVEGYVGGCMLP
jgi:hypothetical protein